MSNSIAPGSSADVNVRVTALTTNPNVPVTYKTIILKKNLVNGVNTLTQEMMNQTNTKYVIKYDYVLGEDITVPANCVLEFDGGSVSDGVVNVNLGYVINIPSSCYGVVYNYLEIERDYIDFTWFYKSTDADYSNAMTLALSAAHTLNKPIFIPEGKWQVELVDIIYDNITIYGCGEASVLYNHTWQNWTFRTEKDYIEIYNIKFEAIPHTEVGGRSYAEEEYDNGACAILAKGSYCTFHDLFFEEFYLGIFFGGDFLSVSNMQDGNSMYNIKCHNINFNSIAWQNNFVCHDIYGDCGTFTRDGYEGGTDTNKDGTPRIANLCHLVYFTAKNNNITAYNITSFDCKGGGSTLAVKNVVNSHIHNITAWKSAVIQTNNCVGVEYEGICAFEQDADQRYVIQATNITKSTFSNVFFKDSTYYSIFRIGAGCDDVLIKDVTICCYIPSISGSYVLCIDLLNSNKVIVEDVNIIFPNISIPENKRYIRVGTATVIRGGSVPNNYYVYNPNNETFTIENYQKVPVNDPNGIYHTNVTNYSTVTPEVLSDRNRIIPNSGGFIRELINISNDKQFCLANIFQCIYIDKEYIILNSGTSPINVRITDIGASQTVHSNYSDYSSHALDAGKAIKLQLLLISGHLFINKTDLFTIN